MFHDCPREGQIIKRYVSPSINLIFLYKPFHVTDWKGNKLQTTLSKTVFSRCKCSGPQEEEVEATAIDEFGNEAECLFTISIIGMKIKHVIKLQPSSQDLYFLRKKIIIMHLTQCITAINCESFFS